MKPKRQFQHPFVIRFTHWMNFFALGIMVTSGLRIYNASPLWDIEFPAVLTLGGWLAGARMWHFFGMWLFLLNGLIWFGYNLLSTHGRNTTLFRQADVSGVLPMVQYYLRIRKTHPPSGKYNALQKLAYTTVVLLGAGAVLTGISLYWPVQFKWIGTVFGGYDTARIWHFALAASFVFFLGGHLVMVMTAGWSNFVSMITGWKRIDVSEKVPRT
jgi:thiosulfate reductase cytochrome b subunit